MQNDVSEHSGCGLYNYGHVLYNFYNTHTPTYLVKVLILCRQVLDLLHHIRYGPFHLSAFLFLVSPLLLRLCNLFLQLCTVLYIH